VRQALARALVVAAFLAAQTAAVSHEVWHARPLALQLHVGTGGKAPQPAKNPLCAFHLVLAGVLGAIQGGHAAIPAMVAAQTVFIAAEIPAARFSTFAPQSRAPPTLL